MKTLNVAIAVLVFVMLGCDQPAQGPPPMTPEARTKNEKLLANTRTVLDKLRDMQAELGPYTDTVQEMVESEFTAPGAQRERARETIYLARQQLRSLDMQIRDTERFVRDLQRAIDVNDAEGARTAIEKSDVSQAHWETQIKRLEDLRARMEAKRSPRN
jgi:chromosome segregation ATPase